MARRSAATVKGTFQPIKMGLGEAIQRLVQVEWQFRTGAGGVPQQLLEERALLLGALNSIPVDVGFDCNADGVPDTVEIFEQAAATSCCRLMPPGTVKKKATKKKAAKKSKARSGRFQPGKD
jgi:hypothetical protein